jgi:hypothetical protein
MCNTIHITLRSSGGVFLVLKDKYTLAPISRKKDFGAFFVDIFIFHTIMMCIDL